MTNTLHIPGTKVRTLAGAALAALLTMLTLTLVAPAAAHAAGGTATVSPSTAAAGEAVTISGSGFLPGEAVDVWYGGPTIASGVADANGDFSVSGAIPAGMPEGGHPMDVVGSMGSMVSFSYTVVAPPTPPAPPAPSAPAPPAASPSSPALSTTGASTPSSPGGTTDTLTGVDPGDGETELALADAAGADGGLGTSAKIWGLVLLVLAAVGTAICAVALRRSEPEQV